jgi:hypothetical protein
LLRKGYRLHNHSVSSEYNPEVINNISGNKAGVVVSIWSSF